MEEEMRGRKRESKGKERKRKAKKSKEKRIFFKLGTHVLMQTVDKFCY